MLIESASTAAGPTHISNTAPPVPAYFLPSQVEWRGFTGMLDAWIHQPTFNHTHYLAPDEYRQAFDYIFLMLGHLRQHLIAVRITDTGASDDKDEIRLIHDNTKFKIRPI